MEIKHPHQQLIDQYEIDRESNPEPWKLWEAFNGSEWRPMRGEPSWAALVQYRRIDYHQKFIELQDEVRQLKDSIGKLTSALNVINWRIDDIEEDMES